MSPARKTKTAEEAIRTFRLTINPATKDTYGIDLAEKYGHGDGPTNPVVTATPAHVARVLDSIVTAVKASGHTPGRLTTQREQPLALDEPAGVRLAITLFATQPITKHDRIRALIAGINAMSVEETYYWYAKTVGPDAPQARRALRILLADDKAGSRND